MAHTPGPWVAEVNNNRPDPTWDIVRRDPGGEVYVAHAYECEADARLIACAPEMLEKLKSLSGWLTGTDASLEALIAKAGG